MLKLPVLAYRSCLASHHTHMRTALYRAGLFTQALFYIAAGVNHLWHPRPYMAIMPPHYSDPKALVLLSGLAEICLGLGLLPVFTRRFAAWAIMAMLLVYFDVHIYMLRNAAHFHGIPRWALVARLPVQFVLMGWAWAYTRQPIAKRSLR